MPGHLAKIRSLFAWMAFRPLTCLTVATIIAFAAMLFFAPRHDAPPASYDQTVPFSIDYSQRPDIEIGVVTPMPRFLFERPASTVSLVPHDPTVWSTLTDMIGTPTRPITIGFETTPSSSPVEVNTLEFSVLPDGSIASTFEATARIVSMVVVVAISTLFAILAGYGVDELRQQFSRNWEQFRYRNPGDVHIDRITCFAVGLSIAYLVLWALKADTVTIAVTMGIMATSGFLSVEIARRAAFAWVGIVAMAGYSILEMPLVAPHPSIAAIYGPLGIHGFEIVALSLVVGLTLLYWLAPMLSLRPRVFVDASSRAPLVQDVRIIENRTR